MGYKRVKLAVRTPTSNQNSPIAAIIIEFLESTREERAFQHNPKWSPDVITLANKQLEYGQRATSHGFLISEWENWHADFLEDSPNTDIKRIEPEVWVGRLIRKIWDLNFALWCNRCTKAHGSEETRTITLNAENIDQKLTEQYASMPPQRLRNPCETRVLKLPLEQALRLPVTRKLRIYRRNKTILESYEAQPSVAGPAQVMRNFLLRANPPANIPNNTNANYTTDENTTNDNNMTREETNNPD